MNQKTEKLDDAIIRKDVLEQFQQFISTSNTQKRVLHIYGPAGVGKSFLLQQFEQIANEQDVLFFKIDSNDFFHSPIEFLKHLMKLIEKRTKQDLQPYTLKHCLQTLKELSLNNTIIISIDTYEDFYSLEHWFRQIFLTNLSSNIQIVLADRGQLQGDWIASPGWRKVITSIPLRSFNLKETRQFLQLYSITEDDAVHTMWNFTEGHPLTLSLAAMSNEKLPLKIKENIPEIVHDLTNRWLDEVDNHQLLHVMEAVAMLKNFDQTSLSAVIGQDITDNTFHQITKLSFIQKNIYCWTIHELISDTIRINLKKTNPSKWYLLNERCAKYYYNRIIQTKSVHDIGQFFYHLHDDVIQSTLFYKTNETSLYYEAVSDDNFHEVDHYFDSRDANISESNTNFYSRESNTTYTFHAPLSHNLKEMELIDSSYVRKVGFDSTHLIKNSNGVTVGLTVVVPIHEHTLKYLQTEPISRTYFNSLSQEELKSYATPDGKPSGWFIRLLDYKDPTDPVTRSLSLYNLIPLLLTGGIIITSSPLPFFQHLLRSLGFQEVPNATHYEYGEDSPAPTFRLDVSGPRLAHYLKQWLNQVKLKQMDQIMENYQLTDREQDIVRLVLEEKSNLEIAKNLYIAEVTVKKHLTRVFQKLEVENRRQLIKKLMNPEH